LRTVFLCRTDEIYLLSSFLIFEQSLLMDSLHIYFAVASRSIVNDWDFTQSESGGKKGTFGITTITT